MNHGGKHAGAEPGRLENKRERRRGAAGRAAVLRRAPSDSDCSGETASLSADSGERAPRPAPLAPPRSGKTRSRRRGSEWEVLEGLKDGQRFEKRPDVFNGYLHKKRKWPLKGWHKRFFVIDGGILVYARSPTDVARGRLHGSVDVGLSVISAKARRRRIDIDADEFIYHLRAKTPEVFRTWLNVLKAHRLYRQHLLTFGARESVPKIHPPLEDLPATDTSSHASFTSDSSTEITNLESPNSDKPCLIPNTPLLFESSVYNHKDHDSIFNWQRDTLSKSSLIPLNFGSVDQKIFDLKLDDSLDQSHRSLCSMHCVAKRYANDIKSKKSRNISMNSTDAEKQIISTDLSSLKYIKPQLDAVIDKTLHSYKANVQIVPCIGAVTASKESINLTNQNEEPEKKLSPFLNKKRPETMACFFFTRNKTQMQGVNSLMKRSKKCTNLFRYKNMSEEPPLKNQSSKCLLLGKYKLKANKHIDTEKTKSTSVECDPVCKENNEVQVKIDVTEHKASQNETTLAEYDKIAEKLFVSIFRRCSVEDSDVKMYIEQVIQDLYDIKLDQESHPVKALFRNLLEYWLKTTSINQFREAMTNEKSIDKQSHKYFTKDENLSSTFIRMNSKETQIHGNNDFIAQNKTNTAKPNGTKGLIKVPINEQKPKRLSDSFEKERRIQELERLLRNTVYVCETGCNNNMNKEKDIKITKQLIDNLGKSRNSDKNASKENPAIAKSNSSEELPEIQDTINHLINETAIPPDVAKEFLGAYLDVLLQDSSKSTTTSQSSDWVKQSKEIPVCDVLTEAVVKKVSKSMTTLNVLNYSVTDNLPMQNAVPDIEKQTDPGQDYLKDILDKVTTIFTKVKKIDSDAWQKNKPKEDPERPNMNVQKTIKDELGRPIFKSKNDIIYENCDDNSLVIDLSRYNLEHISMFNDPAIKDIMSITIKLKEKPSNNGESKKTHLNMKFPDQAKSIVSNMDKSDDWMHFKNLNNSTSSDIFYKISADLKNVPGCGLTNIDTIDMKPYLSNSDGTSKAHRPHNESRYSLFEPTTTQTKYTKASVIDKRENDDLQSYYIMSIKKGIIASRFQFKQKSNLKRCECDGIFIKPREHSPKKSFASTKSDEISALDKPAPRVIDEKFILLLLENLSFLSKTVPTLHKDINALHVKLKKKYEKMVKNNNNVQGLSLLGKIYSEDPYSKDGEDRSTQYDPNVNKEACYASTNTNINKIEMKCACTYTHYKVDQNTEVRTNFDGAFNSKLVNSLENNEVTCFNEPNTNVTEINTPAFNKDRMTVTETETIGIETSNRSTSNPNWIKTKKITQVCDRGVNTIIQFLFNEGNLEIPPGISDKSMRNEKQCLKQKNKSLKLRQHLLNEISLLCPIFKVSTQSQTDRQFISFGIEKRTEKDFNICQLFMSKKYGVKGSSSMMSSSLSIDRGINDEMKTLYRCSSDPSNCSGLLSPTTPTIRGPQAGFVSGTPGGRLAGWIIESGGPLENASRELGQAQLSVQQLQRLLDALELQQQVHHDTDVSMPYDTQHFNASVVSLEGASPNVKKDRRKFGLRKKKSNSKCASVELAPPHLDPSASHTALSSVSALTAPPSPGGGAGSAHNSAASLPIACAAARPQSLPGAESLNTVPGPASLTSLTPDHQLREDFTVLAKDLVTNLKSIVAGLVCERGRLRAALEAAESTATPGGAVLAALRTNLTSALQQNSELRTRLARIHDASDVAEALAAAASAEAVNRQFQQSLSYSSSCVSASEFFDAEEHEEDDLKPEEVIVADEAGVIELDGDSSSEGGSLSSEEGSASSDNSDGAMLSAEQEQVRLARDGGSPRAARWARRTRLPAPRPSPGGPSLWNLLYKNIGKDLSQISMPVTINEPLNMLQRLCEELEYSELLDAAASCGNAVERIALVAAFAVSAYAGSAHRAASKPFNPLLAETYECVRDDRGFRFLAEQVSHHPPISACHAESPRWCFWQEARIKTKFWGKSMEFQPTGRVHVRLNTTGDHYTWNKVTTCVHNLFGGQRWVDQYGDMHVMCRGSDLTCKLNFVKASSWSHTRHEVRGAVSGGGARMRLAGRWSEALHAGEPPAARCLWRPGAMPPDHEIYYGFTRFAMELNEMEPGMRDVLPHTDTRFRPDQRALEEGDVTAAEAHKLALEQAQRERRRGGAAHEPAWFTKSVEDGEETWVFSGEYWKAREAGFSDAAPRIW